MSSHVPRASPVKLRDAPYNLPSHRLIQVAGRLVVSSLRPIRRMELGRIVRRRSQDALWAA